jgi:hypothetical protein
MLVLLMTRFGKTISAILITSCLHLYAMLVLLMTRLGMAVSAIFTSCQIVCIWTTMDYLMSNDHCPGFGWTISAILITSCLHLVDAVSPDDQVW